MIGRDRERFQAELVRMAAYERRIVICEFPAYQVWAGGWRSKVTVNSAVSTTLSWMTHTPILFCRDREHAEECARTIISLTANRHYQRLRKLAGCVRQREVQPA